MEKQYQAVIIGGGLAGLTAGVHLSKAGIKVAVIEKHGFPRHKVCGEYVSNEVLPYLTWLQIELAPFNPPQITTLSFSTKSGRSITGSLPLGGFGISRYNLDNLLYHQALKQNCSIIHAQAELIDFSDGDFIVTLSDGVKIKSKVAIGAFGKRSNLDIKLRRRFIQRKSPWLAVKGHYTGDVPENIVGLHNFAGGYCGVSKIENGKINICYLANYKSFKKHTNPEDYQQHVLYKNPHLKIIFENSKPVFEKPLAISQISFEEKKCVENNMLMVGDTAGLIHPFCGNGMAIAIHSAKIASEQVLAFLNGEISRVEMERSYASRWKSNFKARLRNGRVLAQIMRSDTLSDLLMKGLLAVPSLLPRIIKMTHGKPIVINS